MFSPSVSLLIGNYLFLSHPNRFFCFCLPDLQRSSFLLSQHHAFVKIPAYPQLPGLSQRCRDLCADTSPEGHITPGHAESLHWQTDNPTLSLPAAQLRFWQCFGCLWAQVSEHHQAVLPEGRRDPGDVRHHSWVLLRGSAELDEQHPGESRAWAPTLLVLPCSTPAPTVCLQETFFSQEILLTLWTELSKQMPVVVSLEPELCVEGKKTVVAH